tara:strand:- start:605 stop:1063 length:459 start_codon:yes stop_codon:yes gene_type:complete
MICPICKKGETSVVDSRPTEDGNAIRRRRQCVCGERFTTFERVQFRELIIIKKNGRKSPFDREKLSKSIYIALKKRPIDTDTVEKFVTNISRSLEELGQSEITSNTIGTMVMEGLKELDPVAYVRFASVYRNFREEKDFIQFVDKINVFKKK